MTFAKSTAENIDLTQDEQDALLADESVLPSWFSRNFGNASEDDLAERYRKSNTAPPPVAPVVAENAAAYDAYRRRLEERFTLAKRMADAPLGLQDNMPEASPNLFPTRVGRSSVKSPKKKSPRVNTKGKFRPLTWSILTLTACAVGGVAGYGAANPDTLTAFARKGTAYANTFWATPLATTNETVIGKKSIRMAKVDVKDVSGPVNGPIPLDISAVSTDAEMPVALKISGLPPEAYLTKGQQVAAGEWMLKAADVPKAELVVPHATSEKLALEVAAFEEKTGLPAAPVQDMQVALDLGAVPLPGVVMSPGADIKVEPAAAMADQGFNKQPPATDVPKPLESLNPEALSLISRGDQLMTNGDVLAARQFYLKAFNLKTPIAAYGMGQTFDPQVYAALKLKGLEPDKQQAASWYAKAVAAGDAKATAALAALEASQP